jgi:hypothetical protein
VSGERLDPRLASLPPFDHAHRAIMLLFRLLDDVHVPGRWHLGDVKDPRGTPIDALNTSQLASGELLTVTITDPGEPLDFSLTSAAHPVASEGLATAVACIAGDDIQVLPLIIDGRRGSVVLHARRSVTCLDEGRSKFVKWTKADHRADLAGSYRMVTRLKVAPERIPEDVHICRIKGWEVALLGSDAVKKAMEHAGCKGAQFEEVT